VKHYLCPVVNTTIPFDKGQILIGELLEDMFSNSYSPSSRCTAIYSILVWCSVVRCSRHFILYPEEQPTLTPEVKRKGIVVVPVDSWGASLRPARSTPSHVLILLVFPKQSLYRSKGWGTAIPTTRCFRSTRGTESSSIYDVWFTMCNNRVTTHTLERSTKALITNKLSVDCLCGIFNQEVFPTITKEELTFQTPGAIRFLINYLRSPSVNLSTRGTLVSTFVKALLAQGDIYSTPYSCQLMSVPTAGVIEDTLTNQSSLCSVNLLNEAFRAKVF
jgi:hypothetical protein